MIGSDDFNLPQDIYAKHLATIRGIKFTPREIEVIAFLSSGRSGKKIASFFAISPRTVENHARNIMIKLECNSREDILDFIEQTGKSSLLKQYYLKLLAHNEFKKSLKDLSLSRPKIECACSIIYWQGQHPENSFGAHLAADLKLAGVSTALRVRETPLTRIELSKDRLLNQYLIYIIPPHHSLAALVDNDPSPLTQGAPDTPKNCLLLLLDTEANKIPPRNLPDFDCLELDKQKTYYQVVFEVLARLLPKSASAVLQKSCASFKSKEEALNNFSQKGDFKTHAASVIPGRHFEALSRGILRNRSYITLTVILISILGTILGYVVFNGSFGRASTPFVFLRQAVAAPIQSDLIIPSDAVLLNRSDLLTQIEDTFKNNPKGIQTIALTGIGGAGKTTLARHYADVQKKSPIVWEINAETSESFQSSFEALSQVLASTDGDKKALKEIKDIKDSDERERKIVQFVRDHLRVYLGWLLIFDNITDTDIQKQVPEDSSAWGEGKIILTTRDSNVATNKHVNHAIHVGELRPSQTLSLFMKIVSQGNKHTFTPTQMEETKVFLENIPPFPLDVSVAAYYLKTTNTSYSDYLENLIKFKKDFIDLQGSILKVTGKYAKTRYGIITLSLQDVISKNKDFPGLLLFLSLLDSQNIPKELLDKYKNNIVVDRFIYTLKKYSLITNELPSISHRISTFSIHRSTQQISFYYLIKKFDLENGDLHLKPIINVLENYVSSIKDNEDFLRMKLLASHCEKFLNHGNLLSSSTRSSIEGTLGGIYFHLGNYIRAKEILKKSLDNFKKNHIENIHTAKTLVYLGNVYRVLDNCKESIDLIERAMLIYKKSFSEDSIEASRALAYLGMAYKGIGNYEKARELLEKSLHVCQKYPENYILNARILVYLGTVYKEIGNYEKSKDILEKSLLIYNKYYPESHDGTAWASAHLGNVYMKLGNYEKSKDFLEQSQLIYNKYYPENISDISWGLVYLGDVYKKLGNYEKAKYLMEKSLLMYRKSFPENHIYIAWISGNLASIYNDLGDSRKSIDILKGCLLIYKKDFPENHIYVAWASILLGKSYISLGNYKGAKILLENSLKIYETNYGKDHLEVAHILQYIGQLYFLESHLETAERFIHNALKIFQKNKNPESYMCLEQLAEIFLKKYTRSMDKGETHSQGLKEQAVNYLTQALNIVKTRFPENSPHIARIKLKLNNYFDAESH